MTGKFTIVIADTDADRRRAAAERIAHRASTCECDTLSGLVRSLLHAAPAVVVIGSLGDDASDAIEAALVARDACPEAKLILVADSGSEAIAIHSLCDGVWEYLKPPADAREIAQAISRALPDIKEPIEGFEEFVGDSEPVRQIKNVIRIVAPRNATVLITGESGTGKEIVARLIHQHSARARAPFVCVNCAAIPDSLLESELFGHERGAFTGAASRQTGQMKLADGGTLFLDEIGDMSALAQSKILRALEQREVQPLGGSRPVPINIRLISATNHHLERLVTEERFRADLFYRLDVTRIELPPLRERAGDIPMLAVHFLRQMNHEYDRRIEGFAPAALHALVNNYWPGNVRQLRNAIEAAAVMCTSSRITDSDLRWYHSLDRAGAGAEMCRNMGKPLQISSRRAGRSMAAGQGNAR